MDERLNPLFTPWKIGNVEIKNRIVMTSMGGTDLFGWMEVNHFDKVGAKFLMEVAKNNVGLVLPGCQPVYNPMLGQWLHKNKKMYDDLAKWMAGIPQDRGQAVRPAHRGAWPLLQRQRNDGDAVQQQALRVLSKPFMDLDRINRLRQPFGKPLVG